MSWHWGLFIQSSGLYGSGKKFMFKKYNDTCLTKVGHLIVNHHQHSEVDVIIHLYLCTYLMINSDSTINWNIITASLQNINYSQFIFRFLPPSVHHKWNISYLAGEKRKWGSLDIINNCQVHISPQYRNKSTLNVAATLTTRTPCCGNINDQDS